MVKHNGELAMNRYMLTFVKDRRIYSVCVISAASEEEARATAERLIREGGVVGHKEDGCPPREIRAVRGVSLAYIMYFGPTPEPFDTSEIPF